ncbi:Protein lplB [Paenibacillus macerans]|uniref:Binding--dependent transport system inner membrane component family protein n=2 Tax=Paenibacillus macerans TaxID=44252 RepID=A0A091A4G3_PAEMA|nr:binding--dependent transport system inner membrane component family protein [Paenibacillus macerans]MDU5950326.1 sugar ABC transporter permease [Paenibacillus macerans]SUD26785.1 Protein lplB [Paenibacillus macerans]GBK62921.1 sugar ABC transporter permease [Paenibacillus macerans]GBK69233.1 sugar ABC transporter permease [Paenibacillus macerans]
MKALNRNKLLYLMIFPGLVYFIVFKYLPMGGLVIAFQDYQPFLGIAGSPWVGPKHFLRLFTEPTFFMLLRNTLILFAMNIVFFFPLPILVALMLNEVRNKWFKNAVQSIMYLPHFMSWVIIVSITYVFLNVDGGVFNELLAALGFHKISFLTSPEWLRTVYILQIIWKELGWSTIIYLAAITVVDTQLYEAAEMDGAGRWRKTWHITLPAIRPVIITLLILKIGSTLDLGFEHMYLMLNSLNREVAEIFDTYIYTAGLKNGQLSFSTTVGLFKGLVGLILVMLSNKLAKKFGEDGVY